MKPLKLCPFCGRKVTIQGNKLIHALDLKCIMSYLDYSFTSEFNLIDAWNRRYKHSDTSGIRANGIKDAMQRRLDYPDGETEGRLQEARDIINGTIPESQL